jgi:hypothetical protein
MSPEGDDDRFFLDRQDGQLRILRVGWKIADSRTLLPLGARLGADAVALGQRSQALLTMDWQTRWRSGSPSQEGRKMAV